MAALSGIRVIEIANWAAAPCASALFAEHGADVIKIEPPVGDGMRGLMHQAATEGAAEIDHPFQFSNRGKRAVALDLTTDDGAALALDLVAAADVVVTNLLPSRRDRMGVSIDAIRERNPAAIVGVLTGFGERGPEADRPGFDLTAFFARSGLSSSVGGIDGAPPRWRPAQGDHVTGLALYAGIVTALLEREHTGTGSVVEASLLGSASWTNAFDLGRAAADGKPSWGKPRERTANATAEAYECGDGRWVQLSLAEPVRGWAVLCDAVERPDLHDDPRFATVVDRFVNMRELIPLLSDAIAALDSATLIERITARGGACALVMTSDEVVADPQTRAAGVMRPVAHPTGEVEVVAPPFHLARDDRAPSPIAHYPSTGADTIEVLGDVLGLSAARIEELAAAGVIGVGERDD